ncbi:MAG: hypothetical protein ACP5QT_05690 [Brevinematia bacterium]
MEVQKEVRIFHGIVLFGMRLLDKYIKEKVKEYKEMAENPKETFTILRKENLALLERESYHIHETIKKIEEINIHQFKTPEEYKEYLLNLFKEFYKQQGSPPACYNIFKEKLEICWQFYNEFHKEAV